MLHDKQVVPELNLNVSYMIEVALGWEYGKRLLPEKSECKSARFWVVER